MMGPLFVKVIASETVPGGKALALVAEDGELVGKQFSCAVENGVDCLGTVTVKFHLDGETIRFAANTDVEE